MPDEVPTLATPSALLVHLPPPVGSFTVVLEPIHMVLAVVVIGPGLAFTVKVATAYMGYILYDMVTTPEDIPVTIPVDEPMVAIDGALLDQ
jgi:hypothetical protein